MTVITDKTVKIADNDRTDIIDITDETKILI